MIGGFPSRIWRGLPWVLCAAASLATQVGHASEAVMPDTPAVILPASVAALLAPRIVAPSVTQPVVVAPAPAASAALMPATPAAPVTKARAAYAYPVAPTAAVMTASFYGMQEAPRGEALLREAMLDAHNGERAIFGHAALVWDDALAADAARYAAEMAQTGVYHHSKKSSRAIPSGENLWMGPRRLYSYRVMAQAFLDEKKMFIPTAKLPDFSTSGYWQEVAHYTQMIWRGTQKVGCAVGDGRDYEYLVCRYFPAGNAYGKGPFDAEEATLAMASTAGGGR